MPTNNEIDYKIDSKIRWKVITDQVDKLSKDEKHSLILAALDYQSGPGLMNTVYMGGLATASCSSVLGRQYMRDTLSWEESLDKASSKQIDAAIQVCMHTIEYMWAHPVTKCPTCGNIVPAGH